MGLAAGGKLPYRVDVSGICWMPPSVVSPGGCCRVVVVGRNGMGGTKLCVVKNVEPGVALQTGLVVCKQELRKWT